MARREGGRGRVYGAADLIIWIHFIRCNNFRIKKRRPHCAGGFWCIEEFGFVRYCDDLFPRRPWYWLRDHHGHVVMLAEHGIGIGIGVIWMGGRKCLLRCHFCDSTAGGSVARRDSCAFHGHSGRHRRDSRQRQVQMLWHDGEWKIILFLR